MWDILEKQYMFRDSVHARPAAKRVEHGQYVIVVQQNSCVDLQHPPQSPAQHSAQPVPASLMSTIVKKIRRRKQEEEKLKISGRGEEERCRRNDKSARATAVTTQKETGAVRNAKL